MKRSQGRNNLHLCPCRDSNTGGSDLCSNTLLLDHGGALLRLLQSVILYLYPVIKEHYTLGTILYGLDAFCGVLSGSLQPRNKSVVENEVPPPPHSVQRSFESFVNILQHIKQDMYVDVVWY